MNYCDVWIILPAYNEASVIADVIRDIKGENFPNIAVVDDGSDDETAEVARQAGALVCSHQVNLGPGAATQTAFELAAQLDAQYLVLLDADGQHEPSDIAALVEPILSDKADIVLGSRFLGTGKIPAVRRLYNFIANFITFIIGGVWLSDSQSGMRALNEKAFSKIELHSTGFDFASEFARLMVYHRLRWCEVPIRVKYSDYSQAKGQNFFNGVETMIRLVIRSLMR